MDANFFRNLGFLISTEVLPCIEMKRLRDWNQYECDCTSCFISQKSVFFFNDCAVRVRTFCWNEVGVTEFKWLKPSFFCYSIYSLKHLVHRVPYPNLFSFHFGICQILLNHSMCSYRSNWILLRLFSFLFIRNPRVLM